MAASGEESDGEYYGSPLAPSTPGGQQDDFHSEADSETSRLIEAQAAQNALVRPIRRLQLHCFGIT